MISHLFCLLDELFTLLLLCFAHIGKKMKPSKKPSNNFFVKLLLRDRSISSFCQHERAALSRSVRRPKGARLSALLGAGSPTLFLHHDVPRSIRLDEEHRVLVAFDLSRVRRLVGQGEIRAGT